MLAIDSVLELSRRPARASSRAVGGRSAPSVRRAVVLLTATAAPAGAPLVASGRVPTPTDPAVALVEEVITAPSRVAARSLGVLSSPDIPVPDCASSSVADNVLCECA